MPLSTETLPNKSLNGSELAQVIEKDVHDVLAHDCMFAPGIAYRRCAYTVMITVHVGDLVGPTAVAKSFARKEAPLEGDAPLTNPPADAQFMAQERKRKVENPNLTRIHNEMPIRSQRSLQPEPGSPFGRVETVETRYAPGDYPPIEPPEDKDVTKREAAKLGVSLG